MENFELSLATHIYFGKDVVDRVGEAVSALGQAVMVVYGQSSVIRSGLLQRVEKCLKDAQCRVVDGGGVLPNPKFDGVLSLAKKAKEAQVDCLLALGGGSVIDTAKALAAYLAASDPDQFWRQHFELFVPVTNALPLAVVLTIPASGSETSDSCVISDVQTGIKRIASGPVLVPRVALLDPTLTRSLPPYQTACGCSDILSHLHERYFTPLPDNALTDRLLEAAMGHLLDTAPLVLSHPSEYSSRSEIMWAGTLAHSPLLDRGRGGGDWACHMIEHALSGFCDVAHGAGLAVLTPAWMQHVAPYNKERFLQYASRVWNIQLPFAAFDDMLERLVASLKIFYQELGLPTTLGDIGIGEEQLQAIADATTGGGMYFVGSLLQLDSKKVLEVLHLAL
ncbi:MAG: iron-containing alcohol dehydrogenase [Sphaerochaeta sp.]|nr:iron-containing alcohol dehydrogenase [Sphaerochaeta sp.]